MNQGFSLIQNWLTPWENEVGDISKLIENYSGSIHQLWPDQWLCNVWKQVEAVKREFPWWYWNCLQRLTETLLQPDYGKFWNEFLKAVSKYFSHDNFTPKYSLMIKLRMNTIQGCEQPFQYLETFEPPIWKVSYLWLKIIPNLYCFWFN